MPIQYKTLSIAGFDGSGGAGLQADLKTFSALGSYGMTVLTALPVQNTCGVRHCYELPIQAVYDQLETIFDDIRPDSIKIGMLFKSEIIECVADFLAFAAEGIPIVLDPVMVAKSGSPLLLPEAIQTLKSRLLPLTTIITPNLPEAKMLLNTQEEDMESLAYELSQLGAPYVLLKGGHSQHKDADDLLYSAHNKEWLSSPRINSENTHGTGCTLSAAIAVFLAKGYSVKAACQAAKDYLFQAIVASAKQSVGYGHGPVHHFHAWW